MIGAVPLCLDCLHYQKTADALVCDAFPAGIPEAILYGDADHHKPFAGDNGIQFAPASQQET